jgi:hypothetical protein
MLEMVIVENALGVATRPLSARINLSYLEEVGTLLSIACADVSAVYMKLNVAE